MKSSRISARIILSLVASSPLAAWTLIPSPAHATDGIPAVGSQAPGFKLKSQEGKTVELKQLKGRWVVLYFYPKDFTKGCTLEAHGFQNDLDKYDKANAVILGVSVQSADSHKDFCAREGLNFKLLADTDYKVSQSYGSVKHYPFGQLAARNTFIIDPAGKIAKEFVGVDPSKHSHEVLAALSELQTSSPR